MKKLTHFPALQTKSTMVLVIEFVEEISGFLIMVLLK